MKNSNEWENLFPKVPDVFHERTLNTLNTLNSRLKTTNRKERKMFMKSKTVIAIAAIIAMIGTISVGAFTLISNRNSKIAELFRADEPMQEKLVHDGILRDVNLSASDGGVTMDVLQTLADENMVYILLKLSSENPRLLECENFVNVWDALQIEGYRNSFELELDEDGRKLPTPDDVFAPGGASLNILYDSRETITDENGKNIHQVYYAVEIHNSEKQDYNGRVITLSFSGLGAFEGKAGDFYTIIEGNWEVSWILEYGDNTRVFELNESIDVNGVEVIVKTVEVSPFSLNIVIDGDSARALQKNATENYDLTYELTDGHGNVEGYYEDNIFWLMNFLPVLDNGEVFSGEDIGAGGGGHNDGIGDFFSNYTLTKALDLDSLVGIRAYCHSFPEYSFEFLLG